MLVAQITDTHITTPGTLLSDIIDTAAALERAVEALNRLAPLPDVTIVTGDLVDHGEPEEYTHLRAILAPLRMPVFVIPGNHDAREPMREAFTADGYLPRQGFLNYVIEAYPLRIVALDTLASGETGGALCEERLQWADHILAGAPDKPTLVLMHHPPFVTGIGRMDQFGFDGRDAFAEIVLRHPQIERIACGHLHRTIETRFAGTVVGTAPSTSHQLVLDLRPEAPPLHFAFEPSGYQLHSWCDGIGLVTHTAVIGDWPGPYSFSKKAPTN
jgi:3',5'-cyclic AMP phosphodiesterase CpdA